MGKRRVMSEIRSKNAKEHIESLFWRKNEEVIQRRRMQIQMRQKDAIVQSQEQKKDKGIKGRNICNGHCKVTR